MGRISVILSAAVIAAAVVAVGSARPLAQAFAGVSLKVSKELVPPGGIAQVKVFVTEPKPISTGGASFSFDGFDSFDGIAINSPADDTFGVAVVNAPNVEVSIVSKSSSFGTAVDYPVVSVAGRIPAATPLGVRFPARIDPGALRLFDPSGAIYPTEIKNGYVQTARGVSIDDVQPGSADLPAGAVVTILGTGFVAGTEIRFNETKLAAVRFISSTRIDVVLAEPARMHGKRIRAVNPDGSKATYYSYQRTSRFDPSAVPVLRDAVPLFPHLAATSTVIRLKGTTIGVAVQNLETASVGIVARLFSAQGAALATRSLVVPGNRYFVKEISELFEMPAPKGSSVRIKAAVPVQAMGISVDAAGTATPLLPR